MGQVGVRVRVGLGESRHFGHGSGCSLGETVTGSTEDQGHEASRQSTTQTWKQKQASRRCRHRGRGQCRERGSLNVHSAGKRWFVREHDLQALLALVREPHPAQRPRHQRTSPAQQNSKYLWRIPSLILDSRFYQHLHCPRQNISHLGLHRVSLCPLPLPSPPRRRPSLERVRTFTTGH